MPRLTWDDTQDRTDENGQRYTHEVNDGVVRYRTYAPHYHLKTIALAFLQGYDQGEGDPAIMLVAEVVHLATGRKARFAFNNLGEFEWHTQQEFIVY